MDATVNTKFTGAALAYSDSLVWGLDSASKLRSDFKRYNMLKFVSSLRNVCTSLDTETLNLYLERNGM